MSYINYFFVKVILIITIVILILFLKNAPDVCKLNMCTKIGNKYYIQVVSPVWARPWGGFRPRLRGGWWDSSSRVQQIGSGDTPWRWRQRRRWGSWLWRKTSGGARTRSNSTFLRDHCYTCVKGQRGLLGRESICITGNRRKLTWQGRWRRWRRWRKRRG